MATERIETLVIGGGAMGSAAAWQLARRSREVVLIERFGPGHTMGASHGASRNFNLSYANPAYLTLLAEALPLWRELERESGLADGVQAGRPILDQVGIVNHGGNPAFDDVAAALSSAGFHSEFLDPAEAERRWPGIHFDQRVLFTPEAGRLDADLAVAALQERVAASATGTVQHFTQAIRLRVVDEDHVLVQTETRDASGMLTATVTYDARRVIVTVGAWTSTLFAGSPSAAVTLPRLVVTQEQPAHFAVLDATHQWPGFNHVPDVADAAYDWWPSPIYGMFTPGQGVKAGWHGVGPLTDPDSRSFESEPAQLALLQRYAREWLPGTNPNDFDAISCTYTTTPDSNFVLDRFGPIVIGAGFSGHGFKFTPAIGRMLADLADDIGSAPKLFAAAR